MAKGVLSYMPISVDKLQKALHYGLFRGNTRFMFK